jgi:hypothetical protein
MTTPQQPPTVAPAGNASTDLADAVLAIVHQYNRQWSNKAARDLETVLVVTMTPERLDLAAQALPKLLELQGQHLETTCHAIEWAFENQQKFGVQAVRQ